MSRVRGPYARFCERTRGSAPLLLDVLSSLPVMPDSLDVILSLTQNHGFLRGGSQVGARDDSLFPSCRTPIRHLRSFERVRTRSRIGVLNLIISGQAPRDDSPLTSFWHVPSQNPGLSSLPVILSLTQNHGFSSPHVILTCSKSGSRPSRKTAPIFYNLRWWIHESLNRGHPFRIVGVYRKSLMRKQISSQVHFAVFYGKFLPDIRPVEVHGLLGYTENFRYLFAGLSFFYELYYLYLS